MLDNLIRWRIDSIANNPLMIAMIGRCGSLSHEKKMITMGYCFARMASHTNGIAYQPISVPEYEMNGDSIIIMLYVIFKKEQDKNNYIQNILKNLPKFS